MRASLGRRALLAGLAAGTAAAAVGYRAAAEGRGGVLATPFPLDAPAGASLGALRPLGGLELHDAAIGFGSLSGLHLDAAMTLTAVNDRGRFLHARLVLGDRLRPAGLAELRPGLLRDGAGRPLARGYAADAEALARLPDGTWLVGFERWHRIRAYRRLDGPGRYVEAPPGLERAPANRGLEALAALADGRWLAIAERLAPPDSGPDRRTAWIGGPGGWRSLAYRTGGADLDPSDATPLPDGGALVLERSFSLFGGFGARIVRLSAAALAGAADGAALEGEEILRLAPPLPADNWEGIAAAPGPDGRALVALVSDDNENALQRTLLLLFEMAE